jgi:hypothetical protein
MIHGDKYDWFNVERYLGCRQALLKVLRIKEKMWHSKDSDVYAHMILTGVEHYIMSEVIAAKSTTTSAVAMWETDVYEVDNP